jgi:cholesterol transport system auxiliary component
MHIPVLALVALLVGACTGGLRSSAAPEQIYVLHAAAAGPGTPLPGVLAVPRPAVHPGLDTDRIALVRAGTELDYYAASRWGDSLPRVMEALVLQALQGGDGFATTLSAERAALRGDFELLLTVRRFEAEYAMGEAVPRAQVALDCVLVTGLPRRVLGRCDGMATVPAAANRMSEIVGALNLAAQRAMAEVRARAVALARAAPR